jgi:hypothetical protein
LRRLWDRGDIHDPWSQLISFNSLIFQHLIELPLHHLKLPPKDNGGYDANADERASEPSNAARPTRHRDIGLGCFFFVAAAAAIFMSFKSVEYADERRWARAFWWLPGLGFLGLAFWLADHAIGFTL